MEARERDSVIQKPLLYADGFKESFGDEKHESIFAGCVTLNPMKLQENWELLLQDNVSWEIGNLPKVIHDAVLVILHSKLAETELRSDDDR